MQKKLVLALLVIPLLLLLTACAPGRFGRQAPPTEKPFIQEFRIGTQGLAMRFMPNTPPKRLFAGEELNVALELENRGTTTIGGPGDRVYLSGFDPAIVMGISPGGEPMPLLEGRTQFVPQGGFDVVTFKAITRPLKNKYPLRLLATACYGYETIASASVCIDPNPYAPSLRQRVCTPTNVPLGGGQGAPIAVNLIEIDASPGKTRFRIHVQNVGGGEVFRAGGQTLNKCGPGGELSFDEFDYVELTDVTVSGTSIRSTCRPLDRGHIRLTNGIGMVNCEFNVPRTQATYQTPLTITLRYGYRQSLLHEMEILPST